VEADALKLFVQNGGTLVGTCNSGLVDEHHIAADTGFPHDLTDLFGLEVVEFDPLPPDQENHLALKGPFQGTHLHKAKWWCDLIVPAGCQVLATYTQDFYAGRPAVTMSQFGLGKAIYIGTVSEQPFYYDLVSWLRTMCSLHQLLRVPDAVEVSMREKAGAKIFFLLNHQASPVRITFYKPMHDFLTERTFTGNYDLPAHGILVLDERVPEKTAPWSEESAPPVAVA
jgi:beta-galactosidase